MGARTLVTAEDLIRMPDSEHCELVKGEVLTVPPTGGEHGAASSRMDRRVGSFVERHRLGAVGGAETGYILSRDPDTVRAPDVSFVSRDRIPDTGGPAGYWPFAPDLAVEVESPGDTPREIATKIEEYLSAGTRLVWSLSRARRTLTVHAPGAEPRVLHEDDILDGGDVLPGFAVRVGEFFEPDY